MPTPNDPKRARPAAIRSARARIVAAAAILFYRHGIRAVGVNTVIATADVARSTFYQHFPSKDDLTVAWLRGDDTRRFNRIRVLAEREAASPADVLPAFFDALAEWVARSDFRGFGFINSAVELSPNHPARPVIVERSERIETYFRDALAAAGCDDPSGLAQEAYILMVGSVTAPMTRGSAEPARRASVSIRRLLAASR